jgi:hypothetical protein
MHSLMTSDQRMDLVSFQQDGGTDFPPTLKPDKSFKSKWFREGKRSLRARYDGRKAEPQYERASPGQNSRS